MRKFIIAIAFVVGVVNALAFAQLAWMCSTTPGLGPMSAVFAANVVMCLRYMWLESGA